MAIRTSLSQRRLFYDLHREGQTYEQIADSHRVSKECVRYWCRRQRGGKACLGRHHRSPTGLLSQFDPKVRYCVLRLRLEHPRWGPNRLRFGLGQRPCLRGLKLPSEASIGRYLHQWCRFRRRASRKPVHSRPNSPTQVHQRWQMDWKVGIVVAGGQRVNLHTIRDPVGEACLAASLSPAGHVGQREKRVTLEQVRSVLRHCFAQWGTLPDEIQTDGEPCLVPSNKDCFPSDFTLWLKGLGVEHLVIHRATHNAEVERCHRTVHDYAVVGRQKHTADKLQLILDRAIRQLTFELPSRADGCRGMTPIQAHPELLTRRRPFRPEQELALFDLRRVDAYLATFTWQRKAERSGRVTLGGVHQRYSVGRAYANREILVRFDPVDRSFVFHDAQHPDLEIQRCPARNLGTHDLMGLAEWPPGLAMQLPLPCFAEQGYVLNEQVEV